MVEAIELIKRDLRFRDLQFPCVDPFFVEDKSPLILSQLVLKGFPDVILFFYAQRPAHWNGWQNLPLFPKSLKNADRVVIFGKRRLGFWGQNSVD
jgi:hypothetical protein